MTWFARSRSVVRGVVFSLCLSSAAGAQQPERHIVFLPGILGSKLCVGNDHNKVVWGRSEASLWNFNKLALPSEFSPADLVHKPCGAIETLQIAGVFKARQYDALYQHLFDIGFSVPGRTNENSDFSVYEFDYDWRLSNFHNVDRLGEFVSENLKGAEFDIVAHSMGGLIARIFIDQNPEGVTRLISLGTPHLGAVEVMRTADSGWSWWQNLAAGGVDDIRKTTLTFPAFYELLPSYNCCKSETDGLPIDIMDPETWSNFQEWLPSNFNTEDRQSFINDSLANGRELQRIMKRPLPQSVEHCIVANALYDTPTQLRISETGGFPEWINGGGDGSVPIYSSSNGGDVARTKPSSNTHQRIFDSMAAQQAIKWCLTGISEPVSLPVLSNYTVTGSNGFAEITSVSAKVDQDVLFATASYTKLRLTLKSNDDLQALGIRPQANLVDLNNPGSPKMTLYIEQIESNQPGQFTYVFDVGPFERAGTFETVVSMEGLLTSIRDGILVLDPQ